MTEKNPAAKPAFKTTDQGVEYIPSDTLPAHDYDGIVEEDNMLPRWWVSLFLLSILFAVIYVPVVHIFDFLPDSELQNSIANAAFLQEQRELELEASGELDKDPIGAGAKYYKVFCVSCHGAYAEGGIGPNLHDKYWIHGPAAEDITAVIANGVAAKGMPQWGPVLGDRKIRNLTAYVMSLWNTEPPVQGKKPEGDAYDMAAIRQVAADTTAAIDSRKQSN